MAPRCIALLSGGLDSMLAVRLMQEQQIAVQALNVRTLFTSRGDEASQAAHLLGVPITVVDQEDEYLDIVRYPRFGYGRGANPCVDCRIYMLQQAKRLMAQMGAEFLVSGEVVGQRAMSQKRRDLDTISHHSGCEDLLLRPLSAKLLRPTLAERRGWVDRARLYDFQGRSRQGLIALATRLGLPAPSAASTGCVLTEPLFALKVFDLLRASDENRPWDFEMLRFGRHFRLDPRTKVVVGKDAAENEQLSRMHQLPDASSTAALFPENFLGPRALVVGPASPAAIEFASGLVLRYSKRFDPDNALLLLETRDSKRIIRAQRNERAERAKTLSTA